jgi:hypothetical protein
MIFKELNRAHNTFLRYAQTHPKSMTLALMGGSTLVGVFLFRIIDGGNDNDYKRNPKQKMSLDEARLIAMLENAKESSWRENVENAIDAQEQFMLPGRGRKEPKFMDSIEERSVEILRNHHEKIDEEERERREEEEEENTTSFWK